MKNIGMVAMLVLISGLTGCQKAENRGVASLAEDASLTGAQSFASNKVMDASSLVVSAPGIVVVEKDYVFSVSLPATGNPGTMDALESVDWNFGDGSAVVHSLAPVHFTYFQAGHYTVTIRATSLAGDVVTLTQPITVMPFQEGRACAVDQVKIAGSSTPVAGSPTPFSISGPACFTSTIVAVSWSLGDGSGLILTNPSISATYNNPGAYALTVTLTVSMPGGQTQVVTLQQLEFVSPAPTTTTLAPVTTTLPPTTTTLPPTTTTTMPTTTTTIDVHPNRCSPENPPRESLGELFSEQQACGVNGHKTLSYRNVKTEECRLDGENHYRWTLVSDIKTLVSEGPCLGQSCQFGNQVLLDGQSVQTYLSPAPVGACQAETRVCQNGVLSGNGNAIFLTCAEGCGAFGPHGTVKNDVVIGEVSVPLTCAYGEEGFFDLFNQVATQTCNGGQIVNSNVHQGGIKSSGSCPTYSYVATERFTACSADCGGTQAQIFECRNDKGVVVDEMRCGGLAPVVTRVCDGNPLVTRVEDGGVRTEDAPSCATCPKNQIGIVVKSREIKTVNNFACVDHSMQQVSSQEQVGAWVEERYCKDFVAWRCSQDSLDDSQAKGRMNWMKKCQEEIPVIKEFLTNFKDVEGDSRDGADATLNAKSRRLYPTFMMTGDVNKPKVWIAPTDKNASCSSPEGIYVAAVCVSSCATPEQEILSDLNGKMKNRTFIEALTANSPAVATLKENSAMNSKSIARTPVQQWVTELMDTEHEILVFHMRSGGVLKITPNHPVLLNDGMIHIADTIKVGDSMVKLGGMPDEVVSIEQTKYYGKVYNLFVNSSDLKRNIVVTNGYLNGTAFYQNEGAKFTNRSLFKRALTRGVF